MRHVFADVVIIFLSGFGSGFASVVQHDLALGWNLKTARRNFVSRSCFEDRLLSVPRAMLGLEAQLSPRLTARMSVENWKSMHPTMRLSVRYSAITNLPIHPPARPSACLSIHSSVHSPIYSFTHPPIHSSTHLFTNPFTLPLKKRCYIKRLPCGLNW